MSKRARTGLAAIALIVAVISVPARADYLYVSNLGGSIKRIAPDGSVTTFADGLFQPVGLALDAAGNLYVGGATISKITPRGAVSRFVVPSGGGAARGLTFDAAGNLYAAVRGANNGDYVGKIAVDGTVTVFHPLNDAEALAFDRGGNLYVSDIAAVQKFTANGMQSSFALGFRNIEGLAFDAAGNLYGADYFDNSIIKFGPSGNASTFATGLSHPVGIAFGSDGYLYAVNNFNSTVSRISPDGTVSTFATGLSMPSFIAIQVPEPRQIEMLATTALALLARRRAA